jgi:hypothetical protein
MNAHLVSMCMFHLLELEILQNYTYYDSEMTLEPVLKPGYDHVVRALWSWPWITKNSELCKERKVYITSVIGDISHQKCQ